MGNYPAIFEGFLAKGVAEGDILPRVNVLTFDAWKEAGRVVRKGEHGVRVNTVRTVPPKRDDPNGKPRRIPRCVSVFHISQTEPLR